MILSDGRPRDWTYLAAFHKKDLPSLEEMAKHIRETHDTDMIEDINQRFENKDKHLNNGIEILGITKTEDVMTDPGLRSIIDNAMGIGTRMQYMATGSGPTSTPSTSDIALAAEHSPPRIDMNVQGWREPIGMKMFYGGISGEVGPSTVNEIGIFTTSSGGIMLNHENFGANNLVRSAASQIGLEVYRTNVFIFSVVVEFCPVV